MSAPRRPVFAILVAALIPAALAAAVVLPLRERTTWSDLADGDFLQPGTWRGLGPENLSWMLSTARGLGRQPLAWLSLALDWTLRDGSAARLHDTNCALHALNAALAGALVFLLLRRTGAARTWLTTAPLAAALAAAAWAVHPLRVEPVAMLSARGELLATAFGLVGASAWVVALGGDALRRGPFVVALTASVAAALSSPVAVAFVPCWIALAVWLGRVRPESRAARRWTAPSVALCTPPVLAFLATWGVRAADGAVPAAERWTSAGQALVLPLWDTLAPIGLHPFRDPPPGHGGSGAPAEWWIRTALAALVLWAAVVSARGRRGAGLAVLSACGAAFAAWLLGRESAGSDSLSYVASLPLFVAAGVWIGDGAGCLLAFLGVPLAAGVIAIPAWTSSGLVAAWRDDATLAAHVLAEDPTNDRVHAWLADRARRDGRAAEAEAAAMAALAPGGARPWSETVLALTALDRGDEVAGAAGLARVTDAAPWMSEPWIQLATLELRRGRMDASLTAARAAARRDPDSARAWTALGRALRAAGDRPGAISAFERALALDPANGRVSEDLDTLRTESDPKRAAPR